MNLFTVKFNSETCKYDVISISTGDVIVSRGNYLDALNYINSHKLKK